MLCVWVHGCDPGRVSDGSRLALYQTLSHSLSIECPSSIFLWHDYVLCVIVPFFLSFLFCFFCSRWSFVDAPLIFPVQQTTYSTVRIGNHVYY